MVRRVSIENPPEWKDELDDDEPPQWFLAFSAVVYILGWISFAALLVSAIVYVVARLAFP
jgi:hypothetical protein